MFNRRNFTFFIILLILIALPLFVFMSQKQQETRQRAGGEEAVVFFSELGANPTALSNINLSPGQQKILALFVDTGTNSINGFDIIVNLGNALQYVNIDSAGQGTDAERFESEIFRDIDRTTGIIRFAKVTSDPSKVISGKLHIGTVAFTVKSGVINGTGTIGTTRAELVSVSRSTPLGILQASLPYTISSSASLSPSSTPNPTLTPTVTPSPTGFVCAQVITFARNPQTGQCQTFPTPCDVPSGWPTCTPSQLSTLSFTLTLQGIGADPGGNQSPKNQQRTLNIQIFDSANRLIPNIHDGLIGFVPQGPTDSGKFTGVVNVGNLAAGSYTVKVKTDKYLRKLIPGILNITDGTTAYNLTPVTLIAGDMNNDNKIDILDYNIIRYCLGNTATATFCPDPNMADTNDNGQADSVDLNLMLRSLSTQQGD